MLSHTVYDIGHTALLMEVVLEAVTVALSFGLAFFCVFLASHARNRKGQTILEVPGGRFHATDRAAALIAGGLVLACLTVQGVLNIRSTVFSEVNSPTQTLQGVARPEGIRSMLWNARRAVASGERKMIQGSR